MEIQHKQATRIVIRDGAGRPVAEITDSVIRTGDGYDVEIARPPTDYPTLAEIEAIASPILIPRQIAGYLGCSQYGINLMARSEPEALGFPVIVIGNRVKIPKEGFLNYCRGKKELL
ncbi:MAG: hypothetical protein NC084_10875 [Bacteroides sp.]|nr:hypothetical protein [Eubacterium sp.]MCM1419376.1 hypothetical protein [Roseburia sp.]MCM1463198.1 hypothetical protein [Bacteroides sp.]